MEENERPQRLVDRGSAEIAVIGEMIEEAFDVVTRCACHSIPALIFLKQDVPFDPTDVGFFGRISETTASNTRPNFIKELAHGLGQLCKNPRLFA